MNHGDTETQRGAVLDACCGPRMMWFNRADARAIFVDRRRETHMAKDCSVKNGERQIVVEPDLLADFTNLPFADETFAMVVFDPPHVARNGSTSWLLKKYGKLSGDWRSILKFGFQECFRVLKPDGTLIFKWAETQFPVSQILDLTPERPLFGQRCGKAAKTHWIVFIKPSRASVSPCLRGSKSS